jgi:hypothetical protein
LLEVVASHCKVAWMPLDFRVDALDCGAHHTPEARGSGSALAFEEREDIRPKLDDGHDPNLFYSLKVNHFVFAVNNGSHLRRHEELPQLRGFRASLFLLGEKMIAPCFDDARVALPEPFYYLQVLELGLVVICELFVFLALGVESTFGDLGSSSPD